MRHELLTGSVSGGEAVLDKGIDGFIQNKTRALVSELQGFFKSMQSHHVVIHAGEGQGGIARSHAGDDERHLFHHREKILLKAVFVHQADNDATGYAARLEDFDPSLGCECRFIQPELINPVAKFLGAAATAFDIDWNRGMASKGELVAVRVHKGDG